MTRSSSEGAFLHLLALAVESAVFYLVHFKEYKSTKYTQVTAQIFTFIHFENHGQAFMTRINLMYCHQVHCVHELS